MSVTQSELNGNVCYDRQHPKMAADSLDPGNVSAHPDIRWASLSLTHVEYPEGDIFGKLLAYASMAPLALIVSFLTLILFRRDLHTMTFFSGLVISEGINFVLKHIIKQTRPMARQILYNEYGMPSSHCQFMWFFASYMALFLWVRLHHINNNNPTVWMWKSIASVGCTVVAFTVAVSRIYLQYHTVTQVIVGSLLGAVLGISWFLTTHYILTPWFPVVASWKLSEWLLVKDTTLIPNIFWFEYTVARQENRARSRKLVSMKSQ